MRWFKCSERIPGDCEDVLVFDKDEGVCRGYIHLGSWSHYPIGSGAGDGCLFNVTHWTNLPEKPKD